LVLIRQMLRLLVAVQSAGVIHIYKNRPPLWQKQSKSKAKDNRKTDCIGGQEKGLETSYPAAISLLSCCHFHAVSMPSRYCLGIISALYRCHPGTILTPSRGYFGVIDTQSRPFRRNLDGIQHLLDRRPAHRLASRRNLDRHLGRISATFKAAPRPLYELTSQNFLAQPPGLPVLGTI